MRTRSVAAGDKTDGAVLGAIQELVDGGLLRSPAIERELLKLAPERFPADRVPTQRTIRRIVERMKARDSSDFWTLDSESSDDETRFALLVIASRVRATNGRDLTITEREVRLGARLLRVLPPKEDGSPRLSAPDAWRLARDYLTREDRGESAAGYLVWLAAGADSNTLRDWWRHGFIGLGTDIYMYGIEGPWPPVDAEKVIAAQRRIFGPHPWHDRDEEGSDVR